MTEHRTEDVFQTSIGKEIMNKSTVYFNIGQEFVVTTEDKLTLCLREHMEKRFALFGWLTPLLLLISLLLGLTTSNFQAVLGLKAEEWKAIFLLATLATIVWLLVAALKAAIHVYTSWGKPHGIAEFITAIKKASSDLTVSTPPPLSSRGWSGTPILSSIHPGRELKVTGLIEVPSPGENHGWNVVAEAPENKLPLILPAVDSIEGRAMSVVPQGRYYMDRDLEERYAHSEAVCYLMKGDPLSRIYLRVRLLPRKGIGQGEDFWLAHSLGNGAPKKKSRKEWDVEVEGSRLPRGWASITIPVLEEVKNTYGKEGFVFDRIVAIRIRGELSISAISFLA